MDVAAVEYGDKIPGKYDWDQWEDTLTVSVPLPPPPSLLSLLLLLTILMRWFLLSSFSSFDDLDEVAPSLPF